MGGALDRVPRATAHMVQIKAFLIGETDVVFGEWTAVKSWAGTHGYQFDHQGTGFGEDHPVTGVSWTIFPDGIAISTQVMCKYLSVKCRCKPLLVDHMRLCV